MSQSTSSYVVSTRHPLACVLFVLPLLIFYEAGVALLGSPQNNVLRNGADTWLRWVLSQMGLVQSFWPGIFVGCGLLAWAWCQRERLPKELPNVWLGMVIESALFALLLWGISAALGRMLHIVNITLALENQPDPMLQHLISFLGAGIYEEILFRLVLFSFFYHLFQLGDLSPLTAGSLATLISALIFAAAHHAGASGEPFHGHVFLFRCIAGVFFALLLQWRGFGITVGAHAGYDVLVGVVLAYA